ncbi:hypothetical protein K492DRAFT_200341 [Lichtheimia hyalospora FSU 10163]|nr:hypothetical protein K492DRAFT_200341 [Lichtheimia hyalospora FSU 10163]
MHFSRSLILLGVTFVLGVTAAGEPPTDANAAAEPAKKQTAKEYLDLYDTPDTPIRKIDYNKDVAESTDEIQECAKQLINLLRKRSLALIVASWTALRDSNPS